MVDRPRAGCVGLLTRRTPTAEETNILGDLRRSSTQVHVLAGDVSSRADIDTVLAALRGTGKPVAGVFHLAGVLDDGLIQGQSLAKLTRVFASKVTGAWLLHRATLRDPLEHFVLFSSVAATFGSPGQSNHAAANSFLDSPAHHRRVQGQPGQTINWGPWSGIGAAASRDVSQRGDLAGIGMLTPAEGLQLFERALRAQREQVIAVRLDWNQFPARWKSLPLFAQLVTTKPSAADITQPHSDFRTTLASAPAEQCHRLLVAHLQSLTAQTLGVKDPLSLLPDLPLSDMGLDSLASLELCHRLEESLATPVASTFVFDYPTLNEMAAQFATRLGLSAPAMSPFTASDKILLAAADEAIPAWEAGNFAQYALLLLAPRHAMIRNRMKSRRAYANSAKNWTGGTNRNDVTNAFNTHERTTRPPGRGGPEGSQGKTGGGPRQKLHEPLAIVGVGCRFPDAADPDHFWKLLRQGHCPIRVTPHERWSESLLASREKEPGRITANQGAFLDDVDRWDAAFFGISPREAASLDPQQRLLLTVTWEALEQAGLNPDRLRESRTGVFLGMCGSDYLHRLAGATRHRSMPISGLEMAHGAAAGRLSYFFHWHGPSTAIDTACSSSLVAIHFAARKLRRGLRSGSGRWRESDADTRAEHHTQPSGDALTERALPDFRRRRRRLRARRRLRRRPAQTPGRCPGRG